MTPVWRIFFFPLTLTRFILILVVTLFFLITVQIEDKIARKTGRFNFWTSHNWGRTVLIILGFKLNKNSIIFPDQYILMPNHRSYIDIFLMTACSPSVFVAKAEIKRWPLIGQAAKASRMILVKRDDMKSLLGTMNKIKNSINNNIPVTVFPEGTTCKGPGLKPFKNGTFKIAAELNIPVIPCAIEYPDRNNSWVGTDSFVAHFFRQMWKPVSRVNIRFGTPIIEHEFSVLKDKTHQSIEAMLAEIG